MASAYCHLGELFLLRGHEDEAEEYHHRAVELSDRLETAGLQTLRVLEGKGGGGGSSTEGGGGGGGGGTSSSSSTGSGGGGGGGGSSEGVAALVGLHVRNVGRRLMLGRALCRLPGRSQEEALVFLFQVGE